MTELIKEIKHDIEEEKSQKFLDGDLFKFVKNYNILGDNESLYQQFGVTWEIKEGEPDKIYIVS